MSFCGEMIFCTLLGNFKIHKEDRSAKKNFSELPTVCWAEELTRKSIIKNIRSGWSVAAEEMTNQSPRFYGSFRLIRYASFLRKHYFPQHDKLCAAEGILLNEVLAGNQKLIPAVKLAADAVENYRKTLFIV